MFFNHDYLTSKKSGLRVVWLASTLGKDSRKLNRKEINAVDISKACQSVARPAVPFALRTSGNLMYGVTRVYASQIVYLLQDVQTQHHTVQKVLSEGNGSIKRIDGLIIVGRDTTTIDMPGIGRLNRDAVTLPARFDFLASHRDIDYQWASNEVVGDSDNFMASLASVESSRSGQRQSPFRSNDLVRGMSPYNSPLQGRYTVEPSELRRSMVPSSPHPHVDPFDPSILMADVQAAEEVDFGLEANPIADLTGEMLPLDDQGFDLQNDWQDANDQQGPELLNLENPSPSRQRSRSPSMDGQTVLPRSKRARFALADSSIDVSNEVWRNYSENIVAIHDRMRKAEMMDNFIRRGKQDIRRLLMGPDPAKFIQSGLIDLWDEALAANEALKAAVEDPGVARDAVLSPDAQQITMDDFDMSQWEEDPGVLRGAAPASSPAWDKGVLHGSQSREKGTTLPWNQPAEPLEAAETTLLGDTASVRSARSFSLETPTGLRRVSKRQSSVGAASVGFEAGEEENQVDLASLPFLGNSQEIVDREVANFLSFANHTRAQVPDDQPLFFSDLAPVADSSPYVAARAFYNLLSLATNRLLKVEQQAPFADIKIQIMTA